MAGSQIERAFSLLESLTRDARGAVSYTHLGHASAYRFPQAQTVAGATERRQGKVVVTAGIAREHCPTPLGIVGKTACREHDGLRADRHFGAGMQHHLSLIHI